ncbi:hypothetical protein N7509_001685 [Penicillium cosmopolitanum]|uniref:HNH nuclease domain-containing protein n=1 Tax=Penicillium cosmopolitanum TaxID=1131564 RepID=A0A9X0BCK7_9EURO|nr:uncharacterized protein N7509_001685 [Penicillium cosmopolitanum]KAJ5407802.1 hypothetical protein N7509_001685 [Penicillium cosmopolitanum]
MHGEDTLNTIFGNSHWCFDLHSARNDLLMHHRIAEAFDSGKFVIVPDNTQQSRSCTDIGQICAKPQEYKLQIIDPTWNQLDERIQLDIDITWRDLDGKRLRFISGYRPKIQYVYFHYCLQLLRRVWQYKGLSTIVLDEELDKNLWKLPGSFLPKNMLLTFVKELGPGYENLLQGSNKRIGHSEDPFMLLNVCAWQIFGWQCRSLSSDSDEGISLENM